MAAWQASNGVYFAAINLANLYDAPPLAWDSFRMRTLDGGYLDAPSGFPRYSLSSPVFRDFLRAQARRAVDIGCDGVLIDDVQAPIGNLIYLPPRSAGSFDPVTMAAFRRYLQQTYDATTLQTRFGVFSIGSFDLAEHLRAGGLADSWNTYPLTALSWEFFRFRRLETLGFLRELASSTRDYARQQYGRTFLLTCNTAFDPVGDFVRDAMDFTTNEGFYIRGRDHPFLAPDIRAWGAWKKPQLVLPEPFPPALGVTDPLDRPTANLMRAIIADIQASGGVAGTTLDLNTGLGSSQPVDLAVVRRYAGFILANPQLMTRLTVPATTALLESSASRLGGRVRAEGQSDPWAGPANYIGTARLLLDSGINYQSVFLPDTSYSALPSPSAAELASYKVVIAPSVWAVDDGQVGELLAYVHGGGTLVIIGDFASNQPDGLRAHREQLNALLPAAGEAGYGAGRFVVSHENYGVEYEFAPTPVPREARARFQSLLAPYAARDVVVSGPPVLTHEPGLAPFLYVDRNGQRVLHLVNYDYDDATDQFAVKRDAVVSVKVGEQVVDNVILRSPDIAGALPLPFERHGGTVTVTVPEVEAWVVLSLQPNAGAPVVNGFAPASPVSTVGGRSITFSVDASDPDGNALTYDWTVGGVSVADAHAAAHTWRIPAGASGAYPVRVTVGDGVFTVSVNWIVSAVPYRPPRVLFDETHAERNTLSPERALELSPEHPDWVLLGLLRDALTPDYQVSRLATGTITAEVLAVTDVLVLAAPASPLSPAEIQAIQGFVRSGRGVMVLGDPGIDPTVNALTAPWGIEFLQQPIFSAQNPLCAGCFYLTTFASHAAVSARPLFRMNFGGSFALKAPGVCVGETTAAEWRSSSGLSMRQPGEPGGPFTIFAVAEAGRGRVFAVSDNAFHDDCVRNEPTNTALFHSGLAWVAEFVNERHVHSPRRHLDPTHS